MLTRYYEDPNTLRLGASPLRAFYLPEGAVRSLNGEWSFLYFSSVEDVPEDIAQRPLAGAAGATGATGAAGAAGAVNTPEAIGPVSMPVPSCWQFHGFDRHQYTNTRYPFPFDPPYVPRENPCGVYRRSFAWQEPGRRCYLCFDGVDSCYYVWLNGRFVGYAQVSHTTTEFDVTALVREGENELTVAVVKWCDGSYLEDQDKFRMSGIFRDVYLLSRPMDHLWDLTVTGTPEGEIAVTATSVGEMDGVRCALYAPDGECIAHDVCLSRTDAEAGAQTGACATWKHIFHVDDPQLWTAETPVLYALELSAGGETIRQRVGLRRIEIRDGVVLLNGRPLRLRGVNRHDSHPERGYAVTREDVLSDMRLMKSHNVNAIRTSHYPNSPYFYDMADEYGFYVCAEADVESHGARDVYGDHSLADYARLACMPMYHDAYLDRMQRNVVQHKNHACVIIWSLGNESGYGDNLADSARWTRAYDPTRLVHYENEYAHAPDYVPDPALLDVESSMYPTVESIDAYFSDPKNTRPYILCEYAHAMGLGPGDIEAYWQCFDRHPGHAGGFVWEWRDHTVFAGWTEDGRGKYLYGGDFGEFPHDNNFCVDGLVLPDGRPSTSLLEMKNVYRPARCMGLAKDGRGVLIRNALDFTDLADRFALRWALQRDGVTEAQGECALPSIPPRETREVSLPLPGHPQSDLRLLLTLVRKAGTPLEQIGEEAGFDQLILSEAAHTLAPLKAGGMRIEERGRKVCVTGDGFDYVYDTALGAFERMTLCGRELLQRPIELNIWRAPTDNDMYLRKDWEEAGYDRALTRTYATTAAIEDGVAVIRTRLSLAPIFLQRILTLDVCWTVGADGSVDVKMEAEKCERMPSLPRFGLRLFLPEAMSAVRYLGYGPHESYSDLINSCYRAQFACAAQEMAGAYVRPQESGSRFGCDWAILSGGALTLRAESETPFSFNASPYTQEQLTRTKHDFELTPCGSTVLCLDYKQNGIGSNACGPRLSKEYAFDETRFAFHMRLTPGVE